MLSVAVSRTAAAGGLHSTQRFRLLLSSGSNRLLISRMVKRNDAGCSWRARKLSVLLSRRCAGDALARCVLSQYALRARAQGVWQYAPGEITVNVAERSYGD